MDGDSSGGGGGKRPQRRMSFNYNWDVQQQSASISFSSFGLTLTRRPLDLLDESFERDDPTAPVSLIQLSQGSIFARKDDGPSSAQSKSAFSIGDWFCPKLARHQQAIKSEASSGSTPSLSGLPVGYVDSSTIRLSTQGRFDPLVLEECDDRQHWQRRLAHRQPLPELQPSTIDDDGSSTDTEEEEDYFLSRHCSLVVTLSFPIGL